ncbi:unnamed protein product [Rotaria magnacalcarata]
MRTPSIIIERVAHWLEFFTLSELVFVLSEDARMYPLDKFRIEKIALAIRHTFSSEQSNNDVKMLIEDLFMSYCQTRPLVKPTSISFIKIRHNNHLVVAFRSSCPTCYQSLNINNSCQKCVRLYCHNGSVVTVHHDISILENAASMNQEAICGGYPQLAAVDRRILTNLIHAFLIIQLDISFGHSNVSIPFQLKNFNEWAWYQFPRLLSCFIYLWTNYRAIIEPCDKHCSQCLLVDGHQKCRRPICAFKDVQINTEEMSNLVIGCCRTPATASRYCTLHDIRTTTENLHQSEIRIYNHSNATSCRTLKARSDEYTKACTRSFGLIPVVTNCRIITSFSELYRSETSREIINLFAVTIRVAGKLAPTIVYDDGCHLVKYVKNHIGRDLTKTSAMELLASTPISVDRSHFRNHVGDFSRQNMNPDKNPC